MKHFDDYIAEAANVNLWHHRIKRTVVTKEEFNDFRKELIRVKKQIDIERKKND